MDFKHDPSTDFRDIDGLSRQQARREAAALREGIHYHDRRYYVDNDPEIADAVYDRLFQRLEDLEAAYPELRTPDSPTQRVGSEPVSRLDKVRHHAPMLSLEATLEEQEVADFLDTLRESASGQPARCSVEPKLDGLSVEVVYKGGRFARGITRGNGEVGEDISHNLKTVRTLPLALDTAREAPATLAVRGEVFMRREGFQQVNRRRVEAGEAPFANPRNAAAGLARNYDPRHAADAPLDILFYDILEAGEKAPQRHRETLERLAGWGLPTSRLNDAVEGLEGVRRYHRRVRDARDDLDYEVDGIVIKADDHGLREALGSRHRNPRWALAWKFEPRQETSMVEDIVVQVGRTGILTPVALLQPVDVGGVTVSRATLHNAGEVARKDVRVGDRVRVVRAGDVIPEVQERVKQPGRSRGEPFSMPEHCPSCGAPVAREGAYHLCTAGLACPAQLRGRIEHYGTRNALDIEHLGTKTAQQLVDQGLVGDLADLYTLKTEDIAALDGFARESARQLHDAIQGATRPRLDRFLHALGIPHVGRRVARQLAEAFGDLEAIRRADAEAVAAVPGIGPETAGAVARFFADDQNRDVLERMGRAGVEVRPMPRRKEQPLSAKTVVFTGSLEGFTREEAKERVEALGGRATSSVSAATDYLVVGDGPGSKLEQARELGVERLDEDAFVDLIEN